MISATNVASAPIPHVVGVPVIGARALREALSFVALMAKHLAFRELGKADFISSVPDLARVHQFRLRVDVVNL